VAFISLFAGKGGILFLSREERKKRLSVREVKLVERAASSPGKKKEGRRVRASVAPSKEGEVFSAGRGGGGEVFRDRALKEDQEKKNHPRLSAERERIGGAMWSSAGQKNSLLYPKIGGGGKKKCIFLLLS